MTEEAKPYEQAREAAEERPSDNAYPAEPFPCPFCGQLLAPSCRVCVACKHAIDPAQIHAPKVMQTIGQPPPVEPEPVRFSWRIFLIVFGIWVVGASLVQRHMDPLKGQFVLGGVQILSSFWVLFDALEKRVPKPHRWGIGSLLLWPIIFPWYLARRKQPTRPCPFVEAKVSPITRTALFILLAVFVYLLFKQSPPH